MKKQQASAVGRMVQFRVEALTNFTKLTHEAIETERASLQKSSENEQNEDLLEWIGSEIEALPEMVEMAEQLAFVGLYRIIELRIHSLANRGITPPNKLFNVSNFKRMKEIMDESFGVEIEELPEYRSINEIRLINNAVKHQGRVSSELADEFKSWKKGRPLKGLDQAFKRLSPKVPKFFQALARKLPASTPQTIAARAVLPPKQAVAVKKTR